MSYLRGASGYLLVVDGTRRYTLDKAFSLQDRVENSIGQVPFILLLNKLDLTDDWEIDDATLDSILQKKWIVIKSSAKTGLGVEEAFQKLAEKIVEQIDALPPQSDC